MEISKFRKSKSKIESKYRDLQKSTADMQQQYKADVDKLNQQLIRYITFIIIFISQETVVISINFFFQT